MSNKAFILWTAGVVGLILLFIFWHKIFPPKVPPAGVAGSKGAGGQPVAQKQSNGTYNGITANGLNGNLVLKMGSAGAEVIELQTIMNLTHQADLITDGSFGQDTLTALLAEANVSSITLNNAWATIYVPWYNNGQGTASTTVDTPSDTTAAGPTTDTSVWGSIKSFFTSF